MGFLDANGTTVWFNAAAFSPAPQEQPGAGSSPQRELEWRWFKAACHMVAGACGADQNAVMDFCKHHFYLAPL